MSVINRLPDAAEIIGVAVYPGVEVSVQWRIPGADAWQELRMPIAEANKLSAHLTQAKRDGRI